LSAAPFSVDPADGAGPTTAMAYVAMREGLDGVLVQWMEHVTDAHYEGKERVGELNRGQRRGVPRPHERDVKSQCGRGHSSAVAVRITLVRGTIGRACGRLSSCRSSCRCACCRKIQRDRYCQENESKLAHGEPFLSFDEPRASRRNRTERAVWLMMKGPAAEDYEEVHKGSEIDAGERVEISESDLRIAFAFAAAASVNLRLPS
jgi:hypothetical protein